MSAGHARADVMGYTLRQVDGYLAAIERTRVEVVLSDSIVARMAQADGKAWKAYIKSLKGRKGGGA